MTLVGLLVFVLIAALIWYAIGLLPIDQRLKNIIIIIAIIIFIVILLQYAGLVSGIRIA